MLTQRQQEVALTIYAANGIPYARLAHSPELNQMAVQIGALHEEVWNFLRKSRVKTPKLPKATKVVKLPPLDPGIAALFNAELAAHVSVAERYVYTADFIVWAG